MAALTLSEAQKLDQNELVAGVIEMLVTRSPILERLPFVTFTGDNYEYNQEATRGSGTWLDPDEEITSAGSTFTNVTVAMRYLYRAIDVPNPVQRGLSSVVDQTMVQMSEATLAVRDTFLDTFYYGSNSANTKEPDGVHLAIDNITVPTGATRPRIAESSSDTAGALNLSNVDTMIYSRMKRGVDLITMPPVLFTLFQSASRTTSVTGTIQFTPNQMGVTVPMYAGITLAVDDSMRTTEATSSDVYSAATGGSGVSMFFFRFGEQYFHGAQQTPGFTVDGPFELHNKDSIRMRMKWYVVPAIMKSLYGAGKIFGIDDAAAIVA